MGDGAVNRTPLSRARILDASRRLLTEEGLEALTMRRVARELDVWPMGLYRHVADKEALVEALIEDAAAAVPVPPDRGDWRERLVALLHGLHDVLRAQPPELRGRLAYADAPGMRAVAETGLALLRESNLDPELTWAALLALAVGSALAEPAGPGAFDLGVERLLAESA